MQIEGKRNEMEWSGAKWIVGKQNEIKMKWNWEVSVKLKWNKMKLN